ncbi:hypothetical protein ElyMa_004844200 [Elysia marginata]|uniref:Reverse transcriptase zinc-binding domain-containing protein n=1 Tax=Elysia marginata TaxID=1093978 RepID=A0AAV4IPI4_9GAST|nr:hypothetical protein ElyMa_004844200 [Elysia marginata]
MEQPSHPITYKEAKTIIRNKFHPTWQASNRTLYNHKEPIYKLSRRHQTTVFRLRTGHCRRLNHLHLLTVSHTDECPCGSGQQDVENVLQQCARSQTLRADTWPTEQQKL